MNFKHLKEELPAELVRQILFVGLGNQLRGDDYAGIEFVNRLKETSHFKESRFLIAGTNPENYLENIINSGSDIVVFVDAADNNREAGDVFWIESNEIAKYDFSTHAFSLSIVSDYLMRNRNMKIMYLGIQKSISEINCNISEALSNRIDKYFVEY